MDGSPFRVKPWGYFETEIFWFTKEPILNNPINNYCKNMTTNLKMSPTDIRKNLSGASYPADKQALIKHAKDKGANELVGALNGLPDRQFTSAEDVSVTLGTDIEE